MVVGEPELAARAEHPVGDDAPHLAPADLEAAGQHRPDRGQGDEVADGEVPGPADDLERRRRRRRPTTRRMRSAPGDGARSRRPGPPRRPRGPRPPARPPRPPAPGRRGSAASVAPASPSKGAKSRSQRQRRAPAHQNCLRKRTSFSIEPRMSAISWRIWAQRSMPNPKAKPDHSVAVDAHGVEDGRVDHAAAAELDPAGARAGAAALAAADGAGDLELGRGLGEGEVRRAQARVDVGPEVGRGEGLDRPGQVAEGDAPVDDQPLDLVEDRQVPGVGGVRRKQRPGHHGVDGQRLLPPSGGSAPARCGCAARTVSGSPRSR